MAGEIEPMALVLIITITSISAKALHLRRSREPSRQIQESLSGLSLFAGSQWQNSPTGLRFGMATRGAGQDSNATDSAIYGEETLRPMGM